MMFKNLNKRERNLAGATLLIVSLAFFYKFIIDPIFTGWVNLNDEIESKTNVLKKDSGILSKYKILEAEYAELSRYVKSSKGEKADAADILNYIENISKNDSCYLVNIKPIGTRNLSSYKEVLIDVTAEATMEQFSKFLYDIENAKDMLLRVKQFNINSKTGQAGTLKGTFLVSKILID